MEENGTGALRAAHFFRDHAELEMAGAGAAELFGDRDAEKAHLGEALPERLVVGRLAVEHLAHGLRRALFGEELPRLVAHLFLFVGEIEVHGVLLGLMCGSVGCGGAKRYPSNGLVVALMGFAALYPDDAVRSVHSG